MRVFLWKSKFLLQQDFARDRLVYCLQTTWLLSILSEKFSVNLGACSPSTFQWSWMGSICCLLCVSCCETYCMTLCYVKSVGGGWTCCRHCFEHWCGEGCAMLQIIYTITLFFKHGEKNEHWLFQLFFWFSTAVADSLIPFPWDFGIDFFFFFFVNITVCLYAGGIESQNF